MNRMAALYAAVLLAPCATAPANAQGSDLRLREAVYDANAVVNVPVRRGVVTHLVLAADEAITDIGSGLGGDCARPEAAWCIAAQPGGRNIFVKPKSAAKAPNNLAIVTDRRTHAFRLVVLADDDPKPPVYRLVVQMPAAVRPMPPDTARQAAVPVPAVALPEPAASSPSPSARELVEERLAATPQLVNAEYSVAEGVSSQDIVPTLVFDDGRFTYLRFPGNREVPAVFQVLGDGSEAVVNMRMEGDLLVVDRVARRLMLRAGSAVVGVWNDAFDIEGLPPVDAMTVTGVRRTLKAQAEVPAASALPNDRGARP